MALILCLACASSATASPAAQSSPPDANPLLIYHRWSSASEMKALGALEGIFQARYPDVPQKRTFAPGRGNTLFTILQGLMRAGKPPDAIVMQTGYAMRPFIDAGLIAPLDDLWASERLARALPPTLRAMHEFDGHYYSVPINVQRNNLIWYNKRLLDKHGIDPATLTTWDRLFDAAEKLRAGGVATPMQIAASWTVALGRVARGESAFYTMGDWANGDFRAAGLLYGKDYSAFVVPGTKGLYGVTIDSFVQPRGLARPTNSNRWLKVVASREGQDAFNVLKGSIPARIDTTAAKYDSYQRSAIAAFKQSVIYPTHGGAMPGVYVRSLEPALEAFVDHGDVHRAAATIAAATVSSERSFARVWSLD